MKYDDYLAQCVEGYFNEEKPDEKQERLESHSYSYDEWHKTCKNEHMCRIYYDESCKEYKTNDLQKSNKA